MLTRVVALPEQRLEVRRVATALSPPRLFILNHVVPALYCPSCTPNNCTERGGEGGAPTGVAHGCVASAGTAAGGPQLAGSGHAAAGSAPAQGQPRLVVLQPALSVVLQAALQAVLQPALRAALQAALWPALWAASGSGDGAGAGARARAGLQPVGTRAMGA